MKTHKRTLGMKIRLGIATVALLSPAVGCDAAKEPIDSITVTDALNAAGALINFEPEVPKQCYVEYVVGPDGKGVYRASVTVKSSVKSAESEEKGPDGPDGTASAVGKEK